MVRKPLTMQNFRELIVLANAHELVLDIDGRMLTAFPTRLNADG